MFVRGFGVGDFVLADETFFLRPALIYPLEAPLRAAFVADRFAIDNDEDGIGVGGGQNAEGDPAAFVDVDGEFEFVRFAIRIDDFFSRRKSR